MSNQFSSSKVQDLGEKLQSFLLFSFEEIRSSINLLDPFRNSNGTLFQKSLESEDDDTLDPPKPDQQPFLHRNGRPGSPSGIEANGFRLAGIRPGGEPGSRQDSPDVGELGSSSKQSQSALNNNGSSSNGNSLQQQLKGGATSSAALQDNESNGKQAQIEQFNHNHNQVCTTKMYTFSCFCKLSQSF